MARMTTLSPKAGSGKLTLVPRNVDAEGKPLGGKDK